MAKGYTTGVEFTNKLKGSKRRRYKPGGPEFEYQDQNKIFFQCKKTALLVLARLFLGILVWQRIEAIVLDVFNAHLKRLKF